MAKFPTLRVLLALAAHFDWEIHHLNIKTRFLFPVIKETIYMTPLEGYGEFLPNHKPILKMLKVLECLYGLKQAPFEWYNQVDEFLCSVGFTCLNQNHNLYLSPESIVLLYVDKILIFGCSLFPATSLKKTRSVKYSMVDLGEGKHYRGMHIDRDCDARTIYLKQTRYITKILQRLNMQDCNGIPMPMKAAPLPPCLCDPAEAIKQTEYKSKVGNVMLSPHPDLTFVVSALSKYNLRPITAHHSAMGRVL